MQISDLGNHWLTCGSGCCQTCSRSSAFCTSRTWCRSCARVSIRNCRRTLMPMPGNICETDRGQSSAARQTVSQRCHLRLRLAFISPVVRNPPCSSSAPFDSDQSVVSHGAQNSTNHVTADVGHFALDVGHCKRDDFPSGGITNAFRF
jgi:hypothetical protein